MGSVQVPFDDSKSGSLNEIRLHKMVVACCGHCQYGIAVGNLNRVNSLFQVKPTFMMSVCVHSIEIVKPIRRV